MKIVFFGSSEFAAPSLERLLNSYHEVIAVVTQPDRAKGRNLKIAQTPVKKAASANKNIEIYQPEDVKDKPFLETLKALNADLFVVVAFGQILSREVLDIPGTYSINLHPSLLPKYRGAAPINWAILKGETRTGLSIIRMNEMMDAGDILLQRKVIIDREDTADTLGSKLSKLGSILLLDAVRFIKEDRIWFKRQDKTKATFAPKLKKEDGKIKWEEDASVLHNAVRGLVPWPCAYALHDNKILKIWRSDVLPSHQKTQPGLVVDVRNEAVMVACGKGLFLIKEVQLEGGKRMDIASFLRGHPIETGTVLG
ncbi:MAG: methionyl-tRNA formyltransferase [Candidatus Omnitrophota bacterium]